MNSVLEELFNGNICSEDKNGEQDSTLKKAIHFKQINFDKLMAVLNEPEREIFEKYLDAQNNVEDITRYNTFTYALKFGVLFMTEIFMGRGEIISDNNFEFE